MAPALTARCTGRKLCLNISSQATGANLELTLLRRVREGDDVFRLTTATASISNLDAYKSAQLCCCAHSSPFMLSVDPVKPGRHQKHGQCN